MPNIILALSYGLHELATVVFVGHFFLHAAIYLPVLSRDEHIGALQAISKRSRGWLYASLGIFIATGVYLMFIDSSYRGFADFGNVWSVLMLVKHLVILVMIGIGFWFNGLLRIGRMMGTQSGGAQALARFRWQANAMAVAGVVVLLLTALAQAV